MMVSMVKLIKKDFTKCAFSWHELFCMASCLHSYRICACSSIRPCCRMEDKNLNICLNDDGALEFISMSLQLVTEAPRM
jgi:hypothetical protein